MNDFDSSDNDVLYTTDAQSYLYELEYTERRNSLERDSSRAKDRGTNS